jgi:hypothetical protein
MLTILKKTTKFLINCIEEATLLLKGKGGDKVEIKARITGIKYSPLLAPVSGLKKFAYPKFDINNSPASCIIVYNNSSFGVSKWVTPKRTRSYPYSRVYDTLDASMKITVIPIVKDEGINGDRDYIKWDTISLMSLLNIYVIFAYYSDAESHPSREGKVTKQKFDNSFVKGKIAEIKNYHNSALHWNLKEIDTSLLDVAELAKNSYENIARKLNVKFHSSRGIEDYIAEIRSGVAVFKDGSRLRSRDAQSREMQTIQPKEYLSTDTKAMITIENYLGGLYHFTTDEIDFCGSDIRLIEDKHSRKEALPSKGDIKDGLLKMMLFSNLEGVFVGNKKYNPVPVLRLTSPSITSNISSNLPVEEVEGFFRDSNLSATKKKLLRSLFQEASMNNFIVEIKRSN